MLTYHYGPEKMGYNHTSFLKLAIKNKKNFVHTAIFKMHNQQGPTI